MTTVCWDFDGTLAIRNGMWSGAMIERLEEDVPHHGISAADLSPHLQTGFPWHDPDEVHPEIETPEEWWTRLHPTIETAYRAAGVDGDLAVELAGSIREVYLDPDRWTVYDDVEAALSRLSERGWSHHVLSNHVPELPSLVADLGLDGAVESVWTSGRTGYEKPHPGAFEVVLDELDPSEPVWMVGDSYQADVRGARNVGLDAILVRAEDDRARLCCDRIADVPAVLADRRETG